MNWTVGPLPPTVYWRRRAIVLGGLLLVILLVVNSCGGSGTSQAAGDPTATASVSHPPTSHPASAPAGSPTGTPATPAASGSPTPTASLSSPSTACADSEIKVDIRIQSTSTTTTKLQHGGTFSITMLVTNVSQRLCVRDVGTVPEEITVKRGTSKVWSSGDCGPTPGKPHDLRTFHPGDTITAHVNWNSYRIAPHECVNSKDPAPNGGYQVVGQVGPDVSPTVGFTIQP